MNTKAKQATGWKEKLHRFFNTAFDLERLPFYFIYTFLLVTTIECFARRSFPDGISFLFRSFLPFLINYIIVFITIIPVLATKRRLAWLSFVSALWAALAVTQFVLFSFRVTPLTAVDFSIIGNVITIIEIYLSPFQIILISALLLFAVTAVMLLFLKAPRMDRHIKKAALTLSIVALLSLPIMAIGESTQKIGDEFPNLSDAYKDYGFAYCFSLSVFDKGIDKPKGYDESVMLQIKEELENTQDSEQDTPNVIFVQLESLFDVNRLDGVTFSQDPLPNLSSLKRNNLSGLFTVPVIGAGTVNTEFEVLTGMRVNDFGPGEYPYKSILKDSTCETVAYILAQSGYTAHAIHNHQATFYARNEVYKNLGFSSFTPIEYMLDPEYNDTQWAKDAMLIPEILLAMATTEGQDFVFAVSVQGHGKYPTDYQYNESDPHITQGIDDAENLCRYNYYLKQLHEMDAFVGALTDAVMALEEKTVLVFYGDHLPALSIKSEMMKEGGIFETEYLVLSNYGVTDGTEDKDICAFELYPFIMELINNQNGIINSYHQLYRNEDSFLERLELLEYDLLYGEGYITEKGEAYPTMENMTVGIRPIILGGYRVEDGILTVTGQNFTPYSKIVLDGEKQETVYIDASTLSVVLAEKEQDFTSLTVTQYTDNHKALTSTDIICIPPIDFDEKSQSISFTDQK